jgi:hypothetical protein
LWVDERWFCVTKGFPVGWVESGRVHESDVAVLAADVSNRRMTWV